MRLVMPDAGVLVGIRVDRIKVSPGGAALFAEMNTPELRTWADSTGFDPLRDIEEILIAAKPGRKQQNSALILVRGSFDLARLSRLAGSSAGMRLTSHDGVPVALFEQQKGKIFAVAGVDNTTLACGDPQSVRAAILRRGFASRIDERLTAKAAELSDVFDIWFATVAPVADFAAGAPQSGAALKNAGLNTVQEASGGMTFGPRFRGELNMTARTEKDAAALRDVMQFLVGMAVLNGRDSQVKMPPDLLKVRAEGNTVNLSMELSEAELLRIVQSQRKALLATRPQAQPQAQPAPPQPSGPIVIQSSPGDMGTIKIQQ